MLELLLVAVAVLGYALVSRRLAMSAFTSAMFFTSVGLLVGTGGVGWFDLAIEGEAVTVLVEATLVLVLFSDAVRIDLRELRRELTLPVRLLGIGLPLTVIAGTLVGAWTFPDLGWAGAALLAAVLAPTDAALGQAVVGDPRLPPRVRQTLNVESGLNDGIAVPAVTVLIAVVVAEEAGSPGDWVSLAAREVGFGLAAGLIAGIVGGRLLDSAVVTGRIQGTYRQLATLSVAVLAYSAASLIGGNGFIAAFIAGIAFGHVARDHCAGVQEFAEEEGELLAAVTFVVFGAVLVGPLLGNLDWQIALYAILSLTVVRMLPVLAAMLGSRTLLETQMFFGWFGPRGLASILFALLVLEEVGGEAGETIFAVATSTVLLSVFAHGLTASTWAGRLASRLDSAHEAQPELGWAPELPTRRGHIRRSDA
ncbi:cation:proton antiporter [Janibacter cremeus]|uniref:NhaP-type Na+/H+ or K+/H+ antiporter n=1 Tax=Janibacter cremeus TaxID=1285192 RepID=A0A852VS44_9MICO|nr:sodium:proton antiporter [Janibacter cremeus]NYF98769.1 NhaP-type Na+/H+ or K+/H+ antiporter [Janibacter cremeus]